MCACVHIGMCYEGYKKQYWWDMSSFGCHSCFIWMPLGVNAYVHTHADLRRWVDGNTKDSFLVSLLVKAICKVAKEWKDTGSPGYPLPQFLFAVFQESRKIMGETMGRKDAFSVLYAKKSQDPESCRLTWMTHHSFCPFSENFVHLQEAL